MEKILFFDTETTGLPAKGANWEDDFNEFPHLVSIAWVINDALYHFIIKPNGWEIPAESTAIHGITQERANKEGVELKSVLKAFFSSCKRADFIVGHNIYFDTSIIKSEVMRLGGKDLYEKWDVEQCLWKGKRIDTMRATMKWVDARMQNGRLKLPSLMDLYQKCFPGMAYPQHDALEDVMAVIDCFPVLLKNGLIELKQKEYKEEPKSALREEKKSKVEQGAAKKEKVAKIKDLPKIDDVVERLKQDDLF